MLTSAALFPFSRDYGSELDAYPRHPKSDHVMRIKKLLEVTRSMMTGLDSKRIHRKTGLAIQRLITNTYPRE
jgi:hypothetical protein